MTTVGLIILVVVALGFDFTNGFHDAANAVATAIATRAIRPLPALAMAAALNVVGALVSTKVAATIGSGIIGSPKGHAGLVLVFCALIGAIAWNLITWRLRLPSSSTHALIGGLVGAALASSGVVHWHKLYEKVIVPMVASPLIGAGLSFLLMVVILWTFHRFRPAPVNQGFKRAQILSTAAMAYSHGTQDAQKTMGVITLALVATGHETHFHVPLWVILSAAAAMGAGTIAGGWRIIGTIGSRITPLDPPRGFAAQSVASTVLLVSAYSYAMPVSSTHVITSSVMGVGASRRLSSVRWGVAGEVLAAWILTIPGSALVAALIYAVVTALGLH
ncbi:MAG TPA: inorganic phosphate transporter [Acidimicrobiales bacterium]|jgi:PiT family inorganic phosphate transporter|nr:inorganic phosphate transporter [Acidimicrobiales bacterium]